MSQWSFRQLSTKEGTNLPKSNIPLNIPLPNSHKPLPSPTNTCPTALNGEDTISQSPPKTPENKSNTPFPIPLNIVPNPSRMLPSNI